MFYRRNTRLTRPTTYTFKTGAYLGYTTGVGDNKLGLTKSRYCVNYKATDGDLTQVYGTRSARLDLGATTFSIKKFDGIVVGAYKYEYSTGGVFDNRLLVYLSNGELYMFYVDKGTHEPVLISNSVTMIYGAYSYRLDNEDVMIIATRTGYYILRDTELTLVENAPVVVDFCLHNERVFAIQQNEPYKIRFTGSMDPTLWDIDLNGGGYIEYTKNLGALKKVISFLGYLFVFREYGIERLSTYGAQPDYETVTVYSSSDRIYEKTVCVCGDKIVFLSEKGLHLFDGANVNKVSGVVEPEDFLSKGDKAIATYYKGTYYLSIYVKRFDTEGFNLSFPFCHANNCLILLSLDSGQVSVMGDYDVADFCVYKSRGASTLLFILYHESQTANLNMCSLYEDDCSRLGSVTYYHWRTGMTDFGYPEKDKILRDFTIEIEGSANLTLILDDKKVVLGRLTNTKKTFRLMQPFTRFGYILNGYGANIQRISPPVVRVDMR